MRQRSCLTKGRFVVNNLKKENMKHKVQQRLTHERIPPIRRQLIGQEVEHSQQLDWIVCHIFDFPCVSACPTLSQKDIFQLRIEEGFWNWYIGSAKRLRGITQVRHYPLPPKIVETTQAHQTTFFYPRIIMKFFSREAWLLHQSDVKCVVYKNT